jgi:hypothetical protein
MTLGLYFDWWAMGPGEVFKYLQMGLDKLQVKHVINQPGDINWFVQANRTLYQTPFPDFPNLYLGPNIVELPSECNVMMDLEKYKKVIVPSKWVKDLFSKQIPLEKIEVWHSGIDLNRWCEKKKDIEYDFLVYAKNRNQKDITNAIEFFEEKGLKYKVMNYGTFNQDDLMDVISKSRYGFVICGSETQGIAIAEMISSNLPLLVWDSTEYSHRGPSFLSPATSIPYFDNRCGEVFFEFSDIEITYNKFISSNYSPREYALENFDHIEQTKKILDIIGYEFSI